MSTVISKNSLVPMPLIDKFTAEASLNRMLERAETMERSKNFTAAEEQLLDAVAFSKLCFGAKSPMVANALFHISTFYNRRERYASGRQYFEQLLQVLDSRKWSQ
jgi:hypothetical protein